MNELKYASTCLNESFGALSGGSGGSRDYVPCKFLHLWPHYGVPFLYSFSFR